MAKKKKLTKEEQSKRAQIDRERARLEDYMDINIVSQVECEACSMTDEYEEDGTTEADAKISHSRDLYEKGWRELEAEEDGSIFLACPECVKTEESVDGSNQDEETAEDAEGGQVGERSSSSVERSD